MALLPSSAAVLAPPGLPAPAGSAWEEAGDRRWRLARFSAGWREAIRQLTALRSLEVGVSTWQFVTNSPYLAWRGRWTSRRQEMRRRGWRLLRVTHEGPELVAVFGRTKADRLRARA